MGTAVNREAISEWRSLQNRYLATAAALDRVLEERHELGLSEFEILDLVSETGENECRMRDLVELAPLTQSALSRVVDRLQKAGLVDRKECFDDRRAMFVGLTAKGASVHAQARESYERVLRSEL
ncbi:MarR family winged helix-turn-helix transcriptional regulator [Lysobacter korlensis]|uniref:MarR family winged helix-turn-helix transcriptional regulator n=1 Tax=Lysobacter korlensis TaxID=553636 RepID=A0ABV6RSW4_9GAMM